MANHLILLMPELIIADDARKTWCGKYLIKLKNTYYFIDYYVIKHGSGIVMEDKFAREAPCFQEFQNRRRMEKAMNI